MPPSLHLNLLRRTTCPHCWSSFAAEEVLWVSAHTDLLGDPKLGSDQPQRFLPSRFNVEGNALDARGMVCRSLACPRCHLLLPRAVLEMEPFFISILGTPACGKSYYLTALTWELRRLLPQHFGLSFLEADTFANRQLTEYEESLFLNPRGDELVPMGDLIRKTELQGEQYDTVMQGTRPSATQGRSCSRYRRRTTIPMRKRSSASGASVASTTTQASTFRRGKTPSPAR